MQRDERLVTFYFTIVDRPDAGPAGDGTHVVRFRERRDAEAYAAKATHYGRPATVTQDAAPMRLARRWGLA